MKEKPADRGGGTFWRRGMPGSCRRQVTGIKERMMVMGCPDNETPPLPAAFQEKMRRLLGEEQEAFFSGFDRPPRQGLRVNLLKGSVSQLLDTGLFQLEPVPWTAEGFYYPAQERPGRHPFHEAGAYYIQEPSAMAVAGLLQAHPGERVLDLCAAPGGKTTQIGAAMKGQGLLVANEIHGARAKILSQNVERTGISNCLVLNEAPEKLARRFPGYFDKILVDAPCSGEGMFRKDVQAREQWSTENVALCAARQQQILDCGAQMIRPGGRLVYSTCTFAPEEDERAVSQFLDSHPGFELVAPQQWALYKAAGISSGRPEWADGRRELERTVRLWPHLLEGEGHFAAVLEKRAGQETGGREAKRPDVEEGLPARRIPKEYQAFVRETLQTELSSGCLFFGDHLYQFPAQMPKLDGLRVLRPGLELGVLKKNRFVPAHALALALHPEDALRPIHLTPDGEDVLRYLRGETIPSGPEKGWCLVCVSDYTLGWGKAGGGQLKNHYPKGLRRDLAVRP